MLTNDPIQIMVNEEAVAAAVTVDVVAIVEAIAMAMTPMVGVVDTAAAVAVAHHAHLGTIQCTIA